MSVWNEIASRLAALAMRMGRSKAAPPAAPLGGGWTAVMPAQLREAIKPFLRPDFFFVNIGANDGVTNDPIYPFLRVYGWHGVAVEPLEHVFAVLQRNYAGLPGVILERAAICDTPRRFYHLAREARCDQAWVSQVGSFDRRYILKTIDIMRKLELLGPVPDGLEADLREVEVPCLTFEALMRKHSIERIDFLNVDAEGSDFEIVSSIDLDRYRPGVLCVEMSEMTADQRQQLERHLTSHRYAYLEPFDLFSNIYLLRD